MKSATNNLFGKTLIGGMLVSAAALTPVAAEAQGVVHSISGSGYFVVPQDSFYPGSEPFSFRQNISAWQKADGTIGGSAVVQIWTITRPAPVVLVHEITCLTVEGNTAYFGGVLLSSTDLDYAKPGEAAVGFVTDTHGNGPDVSWSGPAVFFLAPGQDCTSRPFMPPVKIASGNLVVR